MKWKNKPGKLRIALIKGLGGVPDVIEPPPPPKIIMKQGGLYKLMAQTAIPLQMLQDIGEEAAAERAHRQLLGMMDDRLEKSGLVQFTMIDDPGLGLKVYYAVVFLTDPPAGYDVVEEWQNERRML